MAHGSRGYVIYVPDTANQPYYGTTCNLKMMAQEASNNGATPTPAPAAIPFFPGHRGDLRSVEGVDSTKAKDKCVVLSATGGLFALGQPFSDENSNEYTVISLHSERFNLRNLK